MFPNFAISYIHIYAEFYFDYEFIWNYTRILIENKKKIKNKKFEKTKNPSKRLAEGPPDLLIFFGFLSFSGRNIFGCKISR